MGDGACCHDCRHAACVCGSVQQLHDQQIAKHAITLLTFLCHPDRNGGRHNVTVADIDEALAWLVQHGLARWSEPQAVLFQTQQIIVTEAGHGRVLAQDLYEAQRAASHV
jgi:hypothetical protein